MCSAQATGPEIRMTFLQWHAPPALAQFLRKLLRGQIFWPRSMCGNRAAPIATLRTTVLAQFLIAAAKRGDVRRGSDRLFGQANRRDAKF